MARGPETPGEDSFNSDYWKNVDSRTPPVNGDAPIGIPNASMVAKEVLAEAERRRAAEEQGQ